MHRQQVTKAWTPWAVLFVATLLLTVANGRWSVPTAAWLAPIFLLLFLDTQPPLRGLVVAGAIQFVTFSAAWRGIIPVPGAWYFLVTATYALAYTLPFVAHRLLAPRLRGLLATLVLPSAWVGIEFLFQKLVTPYGSWASLAYTQVDQLTLLQLASVTGLGGITFLILWTASTAAWSWRQRDDRAALLRVVPVVAMVLVTVLLWGNLRLTRAPNPPATLRVAAITPSHELQGELMGMLRPLLVSTSPAQDSLAAVNAVAARHAEDLLRRTLREAQAGARVVVWSEHAGRVTKTNEDQLIRQAQDLARENKVVLVLGLGVWDPDGHPAFENKLVAIDEHGDVAWVYHKARPIVGSESHLISAGSVALPILEIREARVAAAICHDLDFPGLIRTIARGDAAVLLGPSSDWPLIAELHARMAAARAVENGVSLVRPAANGRSTVVDGYGRIVAALDDKPGGQDALVADVPVHALDTLYPQLGDTIPYLSLLALLALVMASWWHRRPAGTWS
jgi:apolipoprotein N-acyltransferase